MRRCYKCKIEKEEKEFYKRHSKGRYRGECKKCSYTLSKAYFAKHPEKRKQADLKHRLSQFNLTLKQYQELGEKSNWTCNICQIPQSKCSRKLAIDHDHITKKIRGLLCSNCNHGLGHFKDDVAFLKKAIEYLG